MPPTPVDDHTEDFEQLAGLAAIDALEGEDQTRFDEHASRCEVCRLMVRLDREALARAAPEMDPSPDFKARLMQRAAQELAQDHPAAAANPRAAAAQPAPDRQPIPLRQPAALPPNVIPFWRRTPRWASAVAAVFVLGLVALGSYSYQNQVVASYPLTGSVSGTAVVVVRRSGAAELEMRGVAAPTPGNLYEAWVIPPGGAPVPVGVTPSGDGTMSLEGLSSGATVAITEEPARLPAPTGPIVFKVQL